MGHQITRKNRGRILCTTLSLANEGFTGRAEGRQKCCCIAGTGSGKTMTFWMPLLLREDGIQIVVVPLNVLGKQNVDQLVKAGIPAIAITGENATEENFKVCLYLLICNDRQLNQEDRTLRMANTVLSLQTQRLLLKQSKFGFRSSSKRRLSQTRSLASFSTRLTASANGDPSGRSTRR